MSVKNCARCPLNKTKPLHCISEKDTEWIDHVNSKTCPILYLEEYNLLFQCLEENEKHHIYPQSGGLMNQSPHYLESIRLISFTIKSIQERDSNDDE